MFYNDQLNLYVALLCVANLLVFIKKQFSSNLWGNITETLIIYLDYLFILLQEFAWKHWIKNSDESCLLVVCWLVVFFPPSC